MKEVEGRELRAVSVDGRGMDRTQSVVGVGPESSDFFFSSD